MSEDELELHTTARALCCAGILCQPVLLLIKVTEDQDIFCSSSVLRKAGTKVDLYSVDQGLFVKPA